MAPPLLSPYLLLLAALVGLLGPSEVVAELAEEAGARCPEGLWPLPPQVLPKVTCTRVRPGLAEDVTFLYHPCAHPWLKLQLALLAHVCVAKPSLIPDSNLTRDRRRQWRKQRKKVWFHPDSPAQPSPSVPSLSRGRLYPRGCMQAPALPFALRSWRPPGTEMPSRVPRQHSSSGAKRRGLRAALSLQSTPAGPRVPFASPWSLKVQQPIWGTQSKGANAPSVPSVPSSPGGPVGNASIGSKGQIPKAQGSPEGCACPSQASPAPRAAVPPRAVRGPTPRTEEAAWAAMALTFLLVLLTLATLCTRLHRNFRRGDSIYWGPTADSQDTVAAVLKRRLLMPSRRVKRSRRRPLLPPTPDSGPDVESSD
ncbi:tumor protein p53-inducible protein 13 isoform 2-T2 [Erethizon dorsatum]